MSISGRMIVLPSWLVMFLNLALLFGSQHKASAAAGYEPASALGFVMHKSSTCDNISTRRSVIVPNHDGLMFSKPRYSTTTMLSSSKLNPDDDNDNNNQRRNNNNSEHNSFVNPFERKLTSTTQRASHLFSNNYISLRQMRMKDLMSQLLLAENSVEINQILQENEVFLMEPLLDENAVLDEDSIYKVGMTAQERFEKYNSVMLEREKQASNPQVKNILAAMRQFIMSRSSNGVE